MSTNSDYIKAALRMINVLAEGETPSAEQGADGLSVINALVSSLAGDGIDLGIAPQSSTTADLDIPYEYVGAFKALLAVYLQPYYPASEIPQVVAGVASTGYDRMLRDFMNQQLRTSKMDHLPRGASRSRPYSILTDG